MSAIFGKKAKISGNFLLGLRLQSVSLQKLPWCNYHLNRLSLVQVHDICHDICQKECNITVLPRYNVLI